MKGSMNDSSVVRFGRILHQELRHLTVPHCSSSLYYALLFLSSWLNASGSPAQGAALRSVATASSSAVIVSSELTSQSAADNTVKQKSLLNYLESNNI